MSLFGTFTKVISIIDWFTQRWDDVKKKIKAWNRRRVAKSIRKNIDDGNAPNIEHQLRKLKKRRRERFDGS